METKTQILPIWFSVRWEMYVPTFTNAQCEAGHPATLLRALFRNMIKDYGTLQKKVEDNHPDVDAMFMAPPELLLIKKIIRFLNNALQSVALASHNDGLVVFTFNVLTRPKNTVFGGTAEEHVVREFTFNVCEPMQSILHALQSPHKDGVPSTYAMVEAMDKFGQRTWKELDTAIEKTLRNERGLFEQWHNITVTLKPEKDSKNV